MLTNVVVEHREDVEVSVVPGKVNPVVQVVDVMVVSVMSAMVSDRLKEVETTSEVMH